MEIKINIYITNILMFSFCFRLRKEKKVKIEQISYLEMK